MVCKSHPRAKEVSEISNRLVLICIKTPKATQHEKTEEQRHYTVSPRLALYMTRAKISLVGALTSNKQAMLQAYMPTEIIIEGRKYLSCTSTKFGAA